MRLCALSRCADLILVVWQRRASYVLTKQVSDYVCQRWQLPRLPEGIIRYEWLILELNDVCVSPLGSLFLFVFYSASNNGIGREGVALLAGALCSHNNLTQIHIRYCLENISLEQLQSEHLFPQCSALRVRNATADRSGLIVYSYYCLYNTNICAIHRCFKMI